MARKKIRKPASRAAAAQAAIREGWAHATKALASAEAEVQKQVKSLLKRRRLAATDAAEMLKAFRVKLERERKKALKELESRLSAVKTRLEKERKLVGKNVDKAVHRTLAALDIPSRKEIGELTGKVDELTRKIDAFSRRRR